MKNLKWILDPALGNRARAYLWWAAGLLTLAGQVLDDLEQAGWAIAPAFLVSVLAHLSKFGNRPD